MITDGEFEWVDPIRNTFKDAIHIRQFHNKSCKGIIYLHLRYNRKEYTIRCIWDLVLMEGKSTEKVLQKRIQRARNKTIKKEDENIRKYSELNKDMAETYKAMQEIVSEA